MEQAINIFDLIDTEESKPTRQSKPVVLYGTGGFLKKDPSRFNRNEKLAYVESRYMTLGSDADSDKFVMEVRISRGLSSDSFHKSREYGLYVFNKQ